MAFTERYVSVTGAGAHDGTSAATAWTWAEMLGAANGGAESRAGKRYNIISGTYANTTDTTAWSVAGGAATAAAPCALRGYTSTIGDLEANGRTAGGALVTTNFPAVTWTTGSTVLPAFMITQHVSFASATTGTTVTTGTDNIIRRCVINNTHASGGGVIALYTSTTYTLAVDCDSTTSSSHANSIAFSIERGTAQNCLGINASGVAFDLGVFGSAFDCMARDSTIGARTATLISTIRGMSFRACVTAINNTGEVQGAINCVCWGTGGASKFYNSTTSVRRTFLSNNAIGNCTGGDAGTAYTNLGDWPDVSPLALTADPFTSSTDLTLNSTSGGGADCKGVGLFPYMDIGAIQVQAAAGGGARSHLPAGLSGMG